jgi:hypothetical protein
LRWQCCHRRADLGCQAANARPQRRGSAPRQAVFMVVAIGDVRMPAVPVRPFPVRVASGSGGVPGGVDGVRPDTTGHAVSGRLSDCGVHRGRRTRPRGYRTGTRRADVPASSMGAGGHDGRVPAAGSAWGWPTEHAHCRPVRTARMNRPRRLPWPDGQADAGRWRCPPLGRRRPDRVQTHRLGGHLELGVSGRPDGREVRHVRRPASHCRVSAGGTDRRRRCPGGCPAAAPWRKRAASRTAGMSGMPWRGPGGAHRTVQGWVRGSTSGSGAEACFPPPIGPTDEGGAGGSAGIVSGSRPSALAGRAGVLLDVGSLPAGLIGLRRANRSARLAGVESNIKKSIGHIPLAQYN